MLIRAPPELLNSMAFLEIRQACDRVDMGWLYKSDITLLRFCLHLLLFKKVENRAFKNGDCRCSIQLPKLPGSYEIAKCSKALEENKEYGPFRFAKSTVWHPIPQCLLHGEAIGLGQSKGVDTFH